MNRHNKVFTHPPHNQNLNLFLIICILNGKKASMSIGNIGALLGKSIFSCLRNPTGSEIRSVAVQMSDRLEQCKEVVEVMTRKVMKFLETNMGMVDDNLGQVGNNLEEAWGNLVEEYFSGDNVPALQVNCPNSKPLKLICTLKTAHLAILITIIRTVTTIFDIVFKVVVGAISLPFYYWLLPLPCGQYQ